MVLGAKAWRRDWAVFGAWWVVTGCALLAVGVPSQRRSSRDQDHTYCAVLSCRQSRSVAEHLPEFHSLPLGPSPIRRPATLSATFSLRTVRVSTLPKGLAPPHPTMSLERETCPTFAPKPVAVSEESTLCPCCAPLVAVRPGLTCRDDLYAWDSFENESTF